MRILFDHGTPSGIAGALEGHTFTEAIDRGPHLDLVRSAVNAATPGGYVESRNSFAAQEAVRAFLIATRRSRRSLVQWVNASSFRFYPARFSSSRITLRSVFSSGSLFREMNSLSAKLINV